MKHLITCIFQFWFLPKIFYMGSKSLIPANNNHKVDAMEYLINTGVQIHISKPLIDHSEIWNTP
jgi:hypothetical protein